MLLPLARTGTPGVNLTLARVGARLSPITAYAPASAGGMPDAQSMGSRSLTALVLTLLSGCCCTFELPADECDSDLDCPDEDTLFCNGTRVCRGFLWRRCSSSWPGCRYGEYCDEAGQRCRQCQSEEDSSECLGVIDAGTDAGPPPDGGLLVCGAGPPSTVIGSACDADACQHGLECIPAVDAVLDTVDATLLALCSHGCDPRALQDGCEPCAQCIDAIRVGTQRVPSSELGRAPYCALRCEPSLGWSGCARPGFSCDVVTGTCHDACVRDDECRLVRDESGALVEDLTRPHHCDLITGRCRSSGTPGARVGDACSSDTDCMVDGICLRGDGWPEGGYCTRLDCRWGELACGEGERCHERALERPACLLACTVAAETESERLGASGHGAGCAPGLSCRWDGVSAELSPNGGCVPGNYNDVSEPNLGEPCERDEECYSPFGLGRCAWSESAMGVCVLIDCGDAHPGLGCGEGASCVDLGEDALCLRTCAAPSECSAGLACAPDPSGTRVCAASCTTDADCREGEHCQGSACAFGGGCRCAPLD